MGRRDGPRAADAASRIPSTIEKTPGRFDRGRFRGFRRRNQAGARTCSVVNSAFLKRIRIARKAWYGRSSWA